MRKETSLNAGGKSGLYLRVTCSNSIVPSFGQLPGGDSDPWSSWDMPIYCMNNRIIKANGAWWIRIDENVFFCYTSTILSTDIISFSVSVKVVKKPFSSDTTGAAYDNARPTCSRCF
jgi:hypothetical protein